MVSYARFPRRILAVAVDVVIVYLLGFTLTIAVIEKLGGSGWPAAAAFLGFAAVVVLYEPLLVWRAGGTLGHHALSLRVVAEPTGGNLGFFAALWRWLIKSTLGFVSFIFMAVTRRHQTLHDLGSRSTVRIRDLSRARPWHYTAERLEEPAGFVHASKTRRVIVVLVYGFVVLVGFALTVGAAISDDCALENRCTPTEDVLLFTLVLAWIGLTALVLVLGWKGLLPGCRRKRIASAETAPEKL